MKPTPYRWGDDRLRRHRVFVPQVVASFVTHSVKCASSPIVLGLGYRV